MLDLNRTITKLHNASAAINATIDAAMAERIAPDPARNYIGASSIGHECLRRIQYDWHSPSLPEPRTERIFARGRWFETYAAARLIEAGFRMVRNGPTLGFSQLGGMFAGHADGIIIDGPAIDGIGYPCLWECKGLGSKGWNKLTKDKLHKVYPIYADQVATYQAYFDLTEHPALFTAGNMDTMELQHLLVPFNAARAQAASDRAVAVYRADRAGETLPRIAADDGDWRCRFCPHRAKCWAS